MKVIVAIEFARAWVAVVGPVLVGVHVIFNGLDGDEVQGAGIAFVAGSPVVDCIHVLVCVTLVSEFAVAGFALVDRGAVGTAVFEMLAESAIIVEIAITVIAVVVRHPGVGLAGEEMREKFREKTG